MRVGSLFSGAGLGDYGLMLASMEHAWFCETDPYCRKVLALRWPDVPCYGDIRELKGSDLPPVDLLAGGPPCQPFSIAGKQRGEADDRNLWPETLRLVREIRPSWILFENVPGVLRYLVSTVVPQLEDAGYQNSTDRAGKPQIVVLLIPASACGAPHQRYRPWIVAYTRIGERSSERKAGRVGRSLGQEDVDHAMSGRRTLPEAEIRSGRNGTQYANPWASEPGVCRVDDGVPHRVDRLRALGNGQVVQVSEFIGRLIMKAD